MKILITGAAGFIGMHATLKFLRLGFKVVGIDNLNDYYDVRLKKSRLKIIDENENFTFYKLDINEFESLNTIFKKEKLEFVLHLAAQAGVRYSLINPRVYLNSNVNGFFNILELCKIYTIKNLFYASSSSVYGNENKIPFKESDILNDPASFYGATKIANEIFASAYSNVYSMNIIGLRFFTVYGPWGRPDMAATLFSEAILNENVIKLFNAGNMKRDFTYIDDVVDCLVRLFDIVTQSSQKNMKNNVFNIGNGKPVNLSDFIIELEKQLGKMAKKENLEMQMGDIQSTEANTDRLRKIINYEPNTTIAEGLQKYVQWHRKFYTK